MVPLLQKNDDMMKSSKNKGEKKVNKVYKWFTVATAVVLLGGLVPNVTNASASVGSDGNAQQEKSNDQKKSQHQHDYNDFDAFLQKCFERWGIGWEESNGDKEQTPSQPE